MELSCKSKTFGIKPKRMLTVIEGLPDNKNLLIFILLDFENILRLIIALNNIFRYCILVSYEVGRGI